MIDKKIVEQLVDQWLEGKEYFLTDLTVSPDNRIVVEIDHEEGVWIEDCVELSRYIESGLDRETEDFELEVGSAGIGQPFKVLRQYEIHQGDDVEVLTADGRKFTGILQQVDSTTGAFTVAVPTKVKHEGQKRPVIEDVPYDLTPAQCKYVKYNINFK